MADWKKWFIAYADWIETFELLTNEQAWQLIKYIFEYVNDKNPVIDDIMIKVAFAPIKQSLKRDLVKREETKKARSDAWRKGWEASVLSKSKQRLKSVKQNQANQAVSVSVSVNDSDIYFEQFWILYPNKKGKKKAEEFFSRKIKTQSDFDELLQWLENYKIEHNEKKELWQFVAERQQGDTFLSKETRKEYLEVEKDDITVFQEYVTRYPEDYEYAHKLVAKRWEEKYLEIKAQIAEQQKKALIIQLTK